MQQASTVSLSHTALQRVVPVGTSSGNHPHVGGHIQAIQAVKAQVQVPNGGFGRYHPTVCSTHAFHARRPRFTPPLYFLAILPSSHRHSGTHPPNAHRLLGSHPLMGNQSAPLRSPTSIAVLSDTRGHSLQRRSAATQNNCMKLVSMTNSG